LDALVASDTFCATDATAAEALRAIVDPLAATAASGIVGTDVVSAPLTAVVDPLADPAAFGTLAASASVVAFDHWTVSGALFWAHAVADPWTVAAAVFTACAAAFPGALKGDLNGADVDFNVVAVGTFNVL
jgi:hypothetical protein